MRVDSAVEYKFFHLAGSFCASGLEKAYYPLKKEFKEDIVKYLHVVGAHRIPEMMAQGCNILTCGKCIELVAEFLRNRFKSLIELEKRMAEKQEAKEFMVLVEGVLSGMGILMEDIHE